MSRWEFMRQLESLLSDIPPGEREEALQYYNDYFNDAGRENEQEVIKALGSPMQVAGIVKEGLGENSASGEFTESGYKSAKAFSENPIIKRSQGARAQEESGKAKEGGAFSDGPSAQGSASGGQGGWGQTGGAARGDEGSYTQSGAARWQEKKEGMPTWAIVLIAIACIFLCPFLLGVAGTVIGAVFGAVAAVFGVVLGMGVATVVLFAVGIMLIVAGFGCMFAHPLVGIGLLGGGCICGALGILAMLLTVFLTGKCIPAICKGIVYVCKKIFGRKRGAVA